MELTKEYFDQQLDLKLEPIQNDIKTIKNDINEIKDAVIRTDKRDLEDSNLFKTIVLSQNKRLKAVEKSLKIS